ncbi:Uncharacterised protein [Mycobacteroides abscessus subsp. abscessus]|nr:Uncharacterised protein [Mycobacteroides abscessus subsp. abscessus]
MCGSRPCASATGSSASESTIVSPASVSAVESPVVPMRRIFAPVPYSSPRRAASTCEEVMTSFGSVGMPRLEMWSATTSAVRVALFVT